MAILSKGIKLGYKTTSEGTSYTDLANLQEIPDLGGAAEKVEVTTLADGNRKYINGIKDYGDLEFTFLYDNSGETSNYRILKSLEDAGNDVYWQIEFPDAVTATTGHGTRIAFTGACTTKIVGQGVNSAITFTLTIALNSALTVTNAD